MNDLFVIGLTGQTGAGKGAVSALLRQAGCAVIDADRLARRATQPDSPILPALADRFGGDILHADGTLDRALLAQRAFAAPQATRDLNALTHPYITQLVHEAIRHASQENFRVAVLDAPALFESGEDRICDLTVAVCAPEEIRLKRILARDAISPQAARLRMKAQPSEAYYTDRADMIIRNFEPYGLAEELRPVLDRIREVRP